MKICQSASKRKNSIKESRRSLRTLEDFTNRHGQNVEPLYSIIPQEVLLSSFYLNRHTLGLLTVSSWNHLVQYNKRHYQNILLDSLHVSGHMDKKVELRGLLNKVLYGETPPGGLPFNILIFTKMVLLSYT